MSCSMSQRRFRKYEGHGQEIIELEARLKTTIILHISFPGTRQRMNNSPRVMTCLPAR